VESIRHRLHLAAILVHREIALSKLAEGGLEIQNPGLAIAENLASRATQIR
jgi:hypothetical protein